MRPLVLHNNGARKSTFKSRGYLYFDQITRQLLRDRDILMVASPCTGVDIVVCHNLHSSITEATLKHVGAKYHRLGTGLKSWENLLKIRLTLDFLERSTAEYILHLDGGDVAICGDPVTVVERFEARRDCELLLGAELEPWPGYQELRRCEEDVDKIARIEQFERTHATGPYRHLNSGCYIGRRLFLRRFLNDAWDLRGFLHSPEFQGSDQVLFRELYRTHYPAVRLDERAEIFQCLFAVPRDQIRTKYLLSDGLCSRVKQASLVKQKWNDVYRDRKWRLVLLCY